MHYIEIPPVPRLTPWVHCVWIFEAEEAGAGPDRIVTDGRPELVIHFGAPFAEVSARGRVVTQARAVFAGQVTRPLLLRSPAGAGVLGVRFRPAGARAFAGFPMREATDRRIALDDIVPRKAAALARAIARAGGAGERATIAQDFVWKRIASVGHVDDALAARGVDAIEASAGRIDVAGLAALAGIGRRQLERRFGDAVGIGPTLLTSIFRFRSVFDLIEHDGTRPWTDAAIAAGYYDQSHFIRDFRRFVGCTPSEFHRAREGLAAALVDA